MTSIDRILEGVYRISTFDEKASITFNQYLILDQRPTLVHTGGAPIFSGVLEAIERVAKAQDLAYAFISHFEADECGALSLLQEVAKDLVPICSEAAARQLQGFGLCQNAKVVKPGETLNLGKRRLRFLAYPSEAHLREGLLAYEEVDRVLFTSDLFIRRGVTEQPLVEGRATEFREIAAASIPSPEGRQACLEAIRGLDVRIMALGHGPAVRVVG